MHSQHVEDDFGNCINRILRHGVDRGEAIQSFEGIGQSPIERPCVGFGHALQHRLGEPVFDRIELPIGAE